MGGSFAWPFSIFQKELHQLTSSWTEQPENQVPSSSVLDTAARWRAPITALHAIGFNLQWRRQVWSGTHLRLFTQALLSFMESYLLVFSKWTSPFPQLQLPTRLRLPTKQAFADRQSQRSLNAAD